MKSTGGRLRAWEKAKWGNLWDWIKRHNRETHTSFTLVGTGELTNITEDRDGTRESD